MGEANSPEIEHVSIGEEELFTNGKDDMSNQLCDVLKFFLVKFAIHGADKLLKDHNSRRSYYFANGLDENAILHENLHAHQHSGKDKASRESWNNEFMKVSKVVNSSSGGIIELPLNLLAFFAMSLMKLAGLQSNLVLNIVTFPIWFSYTSLMFLLFPFQTLRQVRESLVRKFLGVLSVSGNMIATKAIRFGWATFWSSYVCFILLGMLASGFLFGGISMRYLLEKPYQATETLNFDYTKASPVAFVPIMSYPRMNNPLSPTVASKNAGPRAIPYNHKLQLTVSLKVPESVMLLKVRVEFLSGNGKVTGSSSYPCILMFKSQPIQFVETIIKSAPLIAGFQSESQILNIKMSEFTEGLEPTACLKVILEQRAEHKPGAGIPQQNSPNLPQTKSLSK